MSERRWKREMLGRLSRSLMKPSRMKESCDCPQGDGKKLVIEDCMLLTRWSSLRCQLSSGLWYDEDEEVCNREWTEG